MTISLPLYTQLYDEATTPLKFSSHLPASLLGLWLSAFAAHAQITAAVAANVQFTMEKMRSDFRQKTGINVKAVYGSSGKLVQWTQRDIDLSQGLGLLSGSSDAKIAIADPRRSPYGREAVKAMRRAGIDDPIEAKLVYGESISQVSQYILSRHADVGFSAKSVVLAVGVVGKGKWVEVDSTLYDRIAQGAMIFKYGVENHPALSRQFFEYLYSDAARKILSEYGYTLP